MFARAVTLVYFISAGGSSTIASLLPTKTLAIGGDTRPDQSGVPAIFHSISHHGKGLSREPQLRFFICIVAAIWTFFLFYDFQVFDVMDDSGI